MEKQKTSLIEALSSKGIVLCSQYLLKLDREKETKDKSSESVTLDDIDAIRRELYKFVDQKESSVSVCQLAIEEKAQNYQKEIHSILQNFT